MSHSDGRSRLWAKEGAWLYFTCPAASLPSVILFSPKISGVRVPRTPPLDPPLSQNQNQLPLNWEWLLFSFKVDVGDGSFVHLRVYRTLPHAGSTLALSAIKTGLKDEDELEYFQWKLTNITSKFNWLQKEPYIAMFN